MLICNTGTWALGNACPKMDHVAWSRPRTSSSPTEVARTAQAISAASAGLPGASYRTAFSSREATR